jgi:ATP-dependent DNA helicase RecG
MFQVINTNQYQKQRLVRGDIIQCFGEIKIGKDGLEMYHPEYRLISKGQSTLLEKLASFSASATWRSFNTLNG